jgi:hypothetical protein
MLYSPYSDTGDPAPISAYAVEHEGEDPWGPPEGARILDAVVAFLTRFIRYPNDGAAFAHALWCAHTHAMAAWDSTPRLTAVSPEPGSGKSRLLEMTELLVPRPVIAMNMSAAYLFRKAATCPTILFDEADTVFGAKARAESEDIRGLINAGHRRGAVAGRCVVRGATVATEEIPAYCAVALAALDDLPDTIMTRAIRFGMRKCAPDERVEPFRPRIHAPEGHALRDRLAAWMQAQQGALTDAWPAMPPQIKDRNADVWEPLLAIADAAGGDWPAKARRYAIAAVTEGRAERESVGVQLLSDIRAAFGAKERLTSMALLRALTEMEESPWGDIRGRPLDARGLARRLRRYGVTSTTFRDGPDTYKGYVASAFADAWRRYCVTDVTEP